MVVRLACVGALLAAAVGKALNFESFIGTLSLLGVGRRLAPVAAAGLVAVEAGTALVLLAGSHPLAGAAALVCLALGFAFASARAMVRRVRVPCSCFGRGGHPLGPRNLVAAALLGGAALLVLAGGVRPLAPSWPLAGQVALAAALLTVLRWLFAAPELAALVRQRHASELEVEPL